FFVSGTGNASYSQDIFEDSPLRYRLQIAGGYLWGAHLAPTLSLVIDGQRPLSESGSYRYSTSGIAQAGIRYYPGGVESFTSFLVLQSGVAFDRIEGVGFANGRFVYYKDAQNRWLTSAGFGFNYTLSPKIAIETSLLGEYTPRNSSSSRAMFEAKLNVGILLWFKPQKK
ncbi:MAG: hypothetical protein AAFR59_19860, partial [Bacteroidota bacterium]